MKGLFAFAAAVGAANAFVARGYNNSTEEMTTSTIFTTTVRTVTHCPETVTDCPNRPHVTTETIAISTTVCPVTQKNPPPPPATTAAPPPPPAGGNITSTLYTTKTFVITSCGPEVPNCPVGHTTTTVIPTGTTCIYVPPVQTPGKPVPPPAQSQPQSPPPAQSQPQSPPPAQSQPGSPNPGCSGDACKHTQPSVPGATTPAVVNPTKPATPGQTSPAQVTAGAARNGFEIAAAAAGLAAFFL